MRVLSLDSAGSACAVCVWEDGKVLAFGEERMERGQDARLVPLVQVVMAQARVNFTDIDRLAITRGPGSFTGLRIGLAAARGFGLAANKPVIGINRFHIHRRQQSAPGKNLLIALASKRAELFVQYCSASGESDDLTSIPAMLAPDAFAALAQRCAPLLLAGDAQDILRGLLPASAILVAATEPETVTAAALASQAELDDPDFLPRPLYLRAPDVTLRGCA